MNPQVIGLIVVVNQCGPGWGVREDDIRLKRHQSGDKVAVKQFKVIAIILLLTVPYRSFISTNNGYSLRSSATMILAQNTRALGI
jgi:hypothetical protein